MALLTERVLRPPPRRGRARGEPRAAGAGGGLAAAVEGAREVARSRYLLLIVGILVAYEIASTMNDFAINVLFERSFAGHTRMTQMYGRLGWVINVTALLAQLALVPLVLPRKRVALLVVPLAMTCAAVGFVAAPAVATVFLLAACDNGLNYSVQQSTKETLYVPLTDVQKYKAKAFIDMFVMRGAKSIAAFAIIAMIAATGRAGLAAPLVVSLAALGVWIALAVALGNRYERNVGGDTPTPTGRLPRRSIEPPPADVTTAPGRVSLA
jgi:AAA family ATP:ADP antiporter